MQKNEETFDLVRKTENPTSISPIHEQLLEDLPKNNDEFLRLNRTYIDSVPNDDVVRASIIARNHSKISLR